MSEEHKCTEECLGQLEDIVARLQEEHQEDLRRIQHLEKALRFIRDDAEDAREMWEEARAALSPSEAPEKEEE